MRERVAWVWCACWVSCRGIGVEGWQGKGAELCLKCEEARIAEEGAADARDD